MAAARQNEMKVSITVVATKTFTAGFSRFGMNDRGLTLQNGPLSLASGLWQHRNLYKFFTDFLHGKHDSGGDHHNAPPFYGECHLGRRRLQFFGYARGGVLAAFPVRLAE